MIKKTLFLLLMGMPLTLVSENGWSMETACSNYRLSSIKNSQEKCFLADSNSRYLAPELSVTATKQQNTRISQATTIPGWERFVANDIELLLPESFEGGNLSQDVDLIVAGLRDLGPDFDEMASIIEQNKDLISLWAFDSNIGSSGGLTNVAIVSEPVVSSMTLDTYVELSVDQLPSFFEVLDQEIVSLDRYDAGRLIIDFANEETAVRQVMYLIKEGSNAWVITYATGTEEFNERLPVFEQSIDTFLIRP